ncbi:Anaphase spindle elongation protein [Meyerozyma sp. JA9]|nr:Anaphase spindle elongation protein [Meyerozyma sp. JA9]
MDSENSRTKLQDIPMDDWDGSTQTPTKNTTDLSHVLSNTKATDEIPTSKFDHIATNVNQAIADLNEIYTKIGFSTTETRIKKAEIFSAIEDTISNFSSSLMREKNNIENECEWLRQQIRIILAMINDDKGERNLRCSDRGIVFEDVKLYEQGYKEDVVDRLEYLQSRRQRFYATSPFNLTSPYIPEEDNSPSITNQYEYMTKTIPQLSLLQLKSNLNRIFLQVLQSFMKPFRKLTELNLAFLDIYDTVGNIANVQDSPILKTLPNRQESEEHATLIHEFEEIMSTFKHSKHGKGNINDSTQFIVSSPRKNQARETQTPISPSSDTIEELRDVNYKLIRVIRCLRITKMSPELFSKLQKIINSYAAAMGERKNQMSEMISKCLTLIGNLSLTEKQLQLIQKNFETVSEIKNGNGASATSEGYFDVETLQFIQHNPTEFGLHDGHLKFVEKFVSTLERLHESKQRKKNHYLKTCTMLWERLDESEAYINDFLSSNHDLSENSLVNFKMELNRLYLKRSEYVDDFIKRARSEIEKLWNDMLYSSEMRQCFKYYDYDTETSDEDKEEVLNSHEVELSTLKQEYEARKPILQLYEQVQELAKDQQFLTESSKDSSRLLSKNSCKILLNEEKIRKKLIKNMPRLINSLKSEVIKFNDSQLSQGKKPLQAYGEDFFEMVIMLESEYVNKKSDKGRNSHSPSRPVSYSPKRAAIGRPSPTKGVSSRSPQRILKPTEISPPKRTGIQKPTKRAPKFSRNGVINSRLTSVVNSMSSFSDMSHNLESPISSNSLNYISGSHMPSLSRDYSQLQPLNSPLKPEESCISQSTVRLSPLQQSGLANREPMGQGDKLTSSPISRAPEATRPEGKENESTVTGKDGEQFSGKRHSEVSNESSFLMSDDYQSWRDQRIRLLNSLS